MEIVTWTKVSLFYFLLNLFIFTFQMWDVLVDIVDLPSKKPHFLFFHYSLYHFRCVAVGMDARAIQNDRDRFV